MKTSIWKLNEHDEISFRKMKNYSDDFLEKLRSIEFSDYLNPTCVKEAYQNFVGKFLQNVNSVPPIRTIRAFSKQ